MKTTNKTTSLLICLAISVGCANKTEMNTSPITHTQVYFDKSGSAPDDSHINTMIFDKVSGMMNSSYVKNGDRLTFFLIHNNTAISDLLDTHSLITELPDNFSELNKMDKRRAEKKYQRNIELERTIAYEGLKKAIDLRPKSTDRAQYGSDLWGVIKSANVAFSRSGSDVQKQVVIVSDLKENVGGRDFHSHAPKTAEEAIALSREDIESLKQKYPELQNHNLKDTRVLVILPIKIFNADHSLVYLDYYWNTLFEEGFGASFEIL